MWNARRWGVRWVGAGVACVVFAAPVWAGAWTVPRHRLYTEYFYHYFHTQKDFDARGNSGRKAKVGMFSDIRNEFKAEYGLTNWLNLLASVPYQSSHYRDDNVDLLNSGAGDIWLRAKLRPFVEPVTTAVQFSWKIPAYDPKISPGLGDGQFDFETRLLLSKAFTYWPYQIEAVHREDGSVYYPSLGEKPAAPRPKTPAPQRHSAAPSPGSRALAMREAILAAEMFQRGRRLLEEGRVREAAAWLRAVLDTAPSHQAAHLLLRQIDPEAEAALPPATPDPALVERAPGSELVTASASDTIVPETRYNGIAFINLEGAFSARRKDPANEFPMVVEAGFTPLKRLMLVGRLDSVVSVRSTNEQIENWAKWDVRAVFNVWGDGFSSVLRQGHRTVNLEVGYSDIFAGRNTADAYEVYGKLGVFF